MTCSLAVQGALAAAGIIVVRSLGTKGSGLGLGVFAILRILIALPPATACTCACTCLRLHLHLHLHPQRFVGKAGRWQAG